MSQVVSHLESSPGHPLGFARFGLFFASRIPIQTRCSLLAIILLVAQSVDRSLVASPSDRVEPPCCRPLPITVPLPDTSLYQLESTWTSDVGRSVKLGVFRGRPQVVVLFFTHCEYACPVLVHELRRLETALPVELRDRVDFLLVSFDSERDTPKTLAEYRSTQQLGVAHWSLLTGAPDDVRELAVILGINYQKDVRGQFAHSNVVTLLDADGRVSRQFLGLTLPVEEAITSLRKIVSVRASSSDP